MKAVFSTFVLLGLLLAGAFMFSKNQPGATAMAETPSEKNPGIKDLETALRTAKASQKFTFVKLGRPNCGNCRALQKMIDSNRVPLPEAKFVFADISTDDENQNKAFFTRFNMSGSTLPFIVIADEQGRMLASRSGYGTEDEFNALLREADSAKAAGKFVAAPLPPSQPQQAAQPSAAAPVTNSAPPTQQGALKKFY